MNKQYFEDFHEEGYGTLGGVDSAGGSGAGGAGALDRVQTTVKQAGIESKCLCESCGTMNAIIVEYPEAIAGSREMAPPNWLATDGHLYPNIGCVKCRTLIAIGYTPQELQAFVLAAVKKGFFSAQEVQRQLLLVDQAKAQAGFRR